MTNVRLVYLGTLKEGMVTTMREVNTSGFVRLQRFNANRLQVGDEQGYETCSFHANIETASSCE